MLKAFQALLAVAALAALPTEASAQEAAPVAGDRAARHAQAELSVELGGGAWLGAFREHLDRDGAYLATPALDFSIRMPIGEHFGIEAIVGSECVIHRYSEPIDGSFFYQEAGLYAGLTIGRAFAWVAGEAGFEHGTLLVTQYSSGVAGAALGLSVPIGDRLSWVATLRFRRGFLQAVTIPEAYETEVIDHPTILTLTAGIAYSL
jgi:hypothetical protein